MILAPYQRNEEEMRRMLLAPKFKLYSNFDLIVFYEKKNPFENSIIYPKEHTVADFTPKNLKDDQNILINIELGCCSNAPIHINNLAGASLFTSSLILLLHKRQHARLRLCSIIQFSRKYHKNIKNIFFSVILRSSRYHIMLVFSFFPRWFIIKFAF